MAATTRRVRVPLIHGRYAVHQQKQNRLVRLHTTHSTSLRSAGRGHPKHPRDGRTALTRVSGGPSKHLQPMAIGGEMALLERTQIDSSAAQREFEKLVSFQIHTCATDAPGSGMNGARLNEGKVQQPRRH